VRSAYTAELAERFSNTALAHRTAQIANDGSQKLPQRIVAAAIERIRAGMVPEHLTLVIAAWIAACEARGKDLPEAHFTDPLDAALAALGEQPTLERVAAVFDLTGFASGKPERQTLIELVAAHCAHIRQGGVTLALSALGIRRRATEG
jgi:fructuronate reductase